jgi:hypothetical protein
VSWLSRWRWDPSSWVLSQPGPGMWDPNESGHRLDMRWVGVYFEADGRFRVTVTFYDRVRMRWFAQRDQFTLSVDFQATRNSDSSSTLPSSVATTGCGRNYARPAPGVDP